jgi:hypothetical protein
VYETTPIRGCGGIDALVAGKDGLVYGFAGKYLFLFDPRSQRVVKTVEHGLGHVIYNAVGIGPKGRIYGLCPTGVFTVDTRALRARVLGVSPEGVSGGFAIRGRQIYFISGPQVYSYTLP